MVRVSRKQLNKKGVFDKEKNTRKVVHYRFLFPATALSASGSMGIVSA
jgi:hypothetical protein